MKIVIVGAGEVGSHLSETLSLDDHDVTVIERDSERAQIIHEQLDVRVINENGSSARTLRRAGVEKCDFFLAMTSRDETNLVSSSLAKALGARTTFARVHDATFRDNSVINHQRHFGIDHLVNPEALAAVELAKHIRNPGRVAVEDFGRGKIEVQSIEIQEGAKIVGIPLLEMKLPGDLRIGLIQRGKTSTVANAQSVLQEGDIVTLFGHPDSLFEAKPLFDPDSQLSKKIGITLLSGSEISISLVRLLSNPRFKIRVIEKDLELCRSLAESLPNVTFVHGEGTSLRCPRGGRDRECRLLHRLLQGRRRQHHDLLAGAQARRPAYHAGHQSGRLHRGFGQVELFTRLELAVSPRIATANEVLRYIGKKSFIELEEGDKCSTCIIELDIGPKSTVSGKRIREVKWPDGCVIVGQESNFIPRMPTGDDILQAGDSIIAIISKEKLKELLKLTK